MAKIIVLIGASGSGKSTLDNHLRTLSSHVRPVTSITTRKKRESDAEGDYDYVSQEEFEKLKEEGKLLWSTQYGENWYGTSEERVLEVLDKASAVGTMVLVPEIIDEFVNYLKSIDRLKDVHFYYVDVSDEVRRGRLMNRDGEGDIFEKRLDEDRKQKEALLRHFGSLAEVIENNGDLDSFLKTATQRIKEKVPKIDNEDKPQRELNVLKNARENGGGLKKLAK